MIRPEMGQRVRMRKLGLALICPTLVCLALAGCTETPETMLDWGVNDHAAKATRPYAAQEAPQTPKHQPPKAAPTNRVQTARLPQPRDPNAPEFAWPVSGPVILAFGTHNGERNDGINIGAAMDTPIHAAAGGTVTYTGNELKDYGNLVLIRHDGGYVTAYAHADKILVKRGEFVTKGQVIGYSGASGDVSSPQLHFEIRHDTQPVDPGALLVARES
jgi:murein DD-endopeptidase MepM/ murein hydrolase activator NlpD